MSDDTKANSEALIATLRDAATVLRSVTSSTTDELRSLKVARDALDAAMCDRLAELAETREYEAEDSSSLHSWATRELRQDAVETRVMTKAGRTLKELPEVAEEARVGRMSLRHLARFTFSLQHVGVEETHQLAEKLVRVAVLGEPELLKQAVNHARAVRHPEELDEAWLRGLDKQHITLSPLPDGWHLRGFLSTETGAKFKALLTALGKPTVEGDARTAGARRLDEFDTLLTRLLSESLPTDGTVRPQIHVMVEAGTLKDALSPSDETAFEATEPATLVGFGYIGPQLLAHLVCGADLVPILVNKIGPNSEILDVGRTKRYATDKQRHAIWIRQGGQCASDGCRHPIDHIHHETPWSEGGLTNLDEMTGRCQACHTHIHRMRQPNSRHRQRRTSRTSTVAA